MYDLGKRYTIFKDNGLVYGERWHEIFSLSIRDALKQIIAKRWFKQRRNELISYYFQSR